MEETEEQLQNAATGRDSLCRNPITSELIIQIDRWNIIGLKIFCTAREIRLLKSQTTEQYQAFFKIIF